LTCLCLAVAVEGFKQREIEGPDPARLGGAGDLAPLRHVPHCTGLKAKDRDRPGGFYPVSGGRGWGAAGHGVRDASSKTSERQWWLIMCSAA
jgi:hypothetical protein